MLTLLRRRDFALLWAAGFVSLAGNWVLYAGLPIFVYRLTGSALATSAVAIAGLVPALLLGSVAGVFVDRWDRRRTMVVADLLRVPAMLLLLAVRSADDVWLVYAVAFAASAIGQFFGPAENALLPRIVDEPDLVAANALNGLNNNLARLIGPPLGGLIAGRFGLSGVALVNAGSFLVAGVLIALISVSGRVAREMGTSANAGADPTPAGPWRAVWHELVDGLRVVRSNRTVATVFAFMAIVSVGEGVFGTLIVVFVDEILGGGAPEVGWLMGAQAVGGVVGAFALGALRGKHRPTAARLLGWGGVGIGAIDVLIFNYPPLVPGIALGLALFVAVGVPAVAIGTGQAALLQASVADAFRGRVFGALGTTASALMIVGALLAGSLTDRLGVVTVLNVQALAYGGAGLLVLVALGGSTIGAAAEPTAAGPPPVAAGSQGATVAPPREVT